MKEENKQKEEEIIYEFLYNNDIVICTHESDGNFVHTVPVDDPKDIELLLKLVKVLNKHSLSQEKKVLADKEMGFEEKVKEILINYGDGTYINEDSEWPDSIWYARKDITRAMDGIVKAHNEELERVKREWANKLIEDLMKLDMKTDFKDDGSYETWVRYSHLVRFLKDNLTNSQEKEEK